MQIILFFFKVKSLIEFVFYFCESIEELLDLGFIVYFEGFELIDLES
jgi:hypothetical protein